VSSINRSEELAEYCHKNAPAGVVIELFNGSSDTTQRLQMKDITPVLDKAHVFIYTATISAGISYENARLYIDCPIYYIEL